MSDVFISYAHEDQPYVRRLAGALEREGFSVWWDHTIPPGKTWNTYIARGIEEAKACIVVWSAHSVASKWVMEEATLGNEAEKLLPVSMDGAPPPMGFRSMQAAQLQNWSGDTGNAQWQLLVREVRSLVGAPARPNPFSARAYQPTSPAPSSGSRPQWAIIGAGATLAVALVTIAMLVSSQGDQAAPAEDYAATAEYPTEVAADPASAATDTTAWPTAPGVAAEPAGWASIVGTWHRTSGSCLDAYYQFNREGRALSLHITNALPNFELWLGADKFRIVDDHRVRFEIGGGSAVMFRVVRDRLEYRSEDVAWSRPAQCLYERVTN